MKTLHLPMKKKWFQMILSGEKKEEYREIKDYWVRRLIDFDSDVEPDVLDEFTTDLKNPYSRHSGPADLLRYFGAEIKQFDAVEFRNGYGPQAPSFRAGIERIKIKEGREEWGAVPGQFYFAITVGVIQKENK